MTDIQTDQTVAEAPAAAPVQRRRINFAAYRKEIAVFVLLLVLCVATSIKNPSFLGADNLEDTSRLIGIMGIFSIGMGVVIITGGIDLSVGSMFALQGVIFAMLLTDRHWPWPLAVIACLALTSGLGLIHGLLITRLNLQPFIVTLCGLLIYRGLASKVTNDSTVGFGYAVGFEKLQAFCTGSLPIHLVRPMFFVTSVADVRFKVPFAIWCDIPAPFTMMVVIGIVMWVVLHRSVYGRHLYAVGRNEEAARYSGINSQAIILSAYVVSGILAGITGILLAFYTNSISPSNHGNSYELYGIAAAVLGGCSLRGGSGSVIGILIGAALLQVLQAMVNLLGISSSLNFAVMGTVILLGVTVDELLKARGARRTR